MRPFPLLLSTAVIAITISTAKTPKPPDPEIVYFPPEPVIVRSTPVEYTSITAFNEPVEPLYTEPCIYTPDDLTRLAKTVWGEAGGIPNTAHKAAVVWCILNRVDDPRFPDTIEEVCIPSQFNGYNPNHPVKPDLYDLCEDVCKRWQAEKRGKVDCGRVLPREYVFFTGDGVENHFRTTYEYTGQTWNWTLPDPYTESS